MTKIIYTLLTIGVSWIGFVGFLELTEANTWIPFPILIGAVMGSTLMSIAMLYSVIVAEIKKYLASKK